MTQRKTNKSVIFIAMILVYIITMLFYYLHTKDQLLHEVEEKVENVLITHRAVKQYIDNNQKTEISRLKQKKLLFHDYFSKDILSSTHISKTLNQLTNKERVKRGEMPLFLKYSSDNPLNHNNISTDYEQKILKKFRSEEMKEFKEIRYKKKLRYFFYALPGARITASCLECHGKPKEAPESIQKTYGLSSGYNLNIGDLSSMLSIEIPLENLYRDNLISFIYQSLFVLLLFVLSYFLAMFVINIISHRQQLHHDSLQLKASLTNYSKHLIRTLTNSSGIFIEASDAFYELTGYTQKELIGQKDTILLINQKELSAYAQIQIILLQGHVYHGEIQLKAKNGNYFWVSLSITPIKDSHERIIEFETVYNNISKQKSLEHDANTDAMTHLLNRRTFNEHFLQEYEKVKESLQYFSFLMIDIDFFKHYNDNYGHKQGDEVLQKVAQSLKQTFEQEHAYVFRLGGEEFGVIFSHTDKAYIVDKTNQCCKDIENLKIDHKFSQISSYITISLGVLITDFSISIDFDDFYRKSDELLYQAKMSGRNCVKVKIIQEEGIIDKELLLL